MISLTHHHSRAYSNPALENSGAQFDDWNLIGAQTPIMAFFCALVLAVRIGRPSGLPVPYKAGSSTWYVPPPIFDEIWGGFCLLIGGRDHV